MTHIRAIVRERMSVFKPQNVGVSSVSKHFLAVWPESSDYSPGSLASTAGSFVTFSVEVNK